MSLENDCKASTLVVYVQHVSGKEHLWEKHAVSIVGTQKVQPDVQVLFNFSCNMYVVYERQLSGRSGTSKRISMAPQQEYLHS